MTPNVRPETRAALLLAALLVACPASALDQAAGETGQTAGDPPVSSLDEREPVTLSVDDMEVRDVLAMLSGSRPLNLVCGEEVSGRVSIQLHEVPFESALRAVVAMAGFEITHRGDIYFIRRDGDRDPRDTLLREARTFRLDYASPDQILGVVQPSLSPLGHAVAYPPLRSLVIEDRPEILDRLGEVIRTLDAPPRQVLIEAQILEAQLSDDMRFGIDWSLVFSHGEGSGAIDVTGFASPAGGTQGMFVSWAEGDFLANLESFEGIERVQTLAAPRLLAIDGAEAEIIIGGQLGFSVLTTVDNTVIQSVEFLDTGAQLRIRPTIAGDGFVLMKIHPELSDGAIEEGLPSKNTAQVSTEVLVRDGHTLLIGGLIREREEHTRKGIPLLVRLPLLGHLFGRTTTSTQRSELITLITTRIVEPGEDLTYQGIGLIQP